MKNSPRIDDRRTLPPATGAKLLDTGTDSRRPSSTAGIAKSPSLAHSSPHIETLSLLVCIAEDCFAKANAACQSVAKSMSADEIKEHHKLVATGLACLEVAMKHKQLSPRVEARLCLRYAGILIEETTNTNEAEIALTRGIAVCEKHLFLDLKYNSQFLLMKTLFQRNPKAALKSIDSHIADCKTFNHVHWFYAFRFLKALFYTQSGAAADNQALDNLRTIARTALQRDEKMIFVMATLLEGLAHLGTMKEDWHMRVQNCIAQAAKLQMDASAHLPQIDILLLFLDLACSLRQRSHQVVNNKLAVLEKRVGELDHSADWPAFSSEVLLPIRRHPNSPPTISNDTRAVIRPGDSEMDYLVLSALGKQEASALM